MRWLIEHQYEWSFELGKLVCVDKVIFRNKPLEQGSSKISPEREELRRACKQAFDYVYLPAVTPEAKEYRALVRNVRKRARRLIRAAGAIVG